MARKPFPRQLEFKVYAKRKKRSRYEKDRNRRQEIERKRRRQTKLRKKFSAGLFDRQEVMLTVPRTFSLITDREEVLRFIQHVKMFKNKNVKSIFFNFSIVKDVSHGAMAILLSSIHDLNLIGIFCRGNVPDDRIAKRQFDKSGFLRFFRTDSYKWARHKSSILVQGARQIDQDMSSKAISQAMETVFGVEQDNQELQGIVIEMMSNTVNHAYLQPTSNSKWYLSTFHEEEQKLVKFCFVDNGQGILKTIYKRWNIVLADLAKPDDVIRKAFRGEYGSSTRQLERGTGLVAIGDSLADKVIGNLKVITNGYFYDFSTNSVESIKHEFDGTFYFWELDINCKYGNS